MLEYVMADEMNFNITGVIKTNNFFRLSMIFATLLTFICILINVQLPKASGYEPSIYSIYPNYYWFSLIFSSLICFLLIYNTYNGKIKACFSPIFIIIINKIIIIFTPLFRGYYYYGGSDSLWHVGVIKEAIEHGWLDSTLNSAFYPIIYHTGVIFHSILGIPYESISLPILLIYQLLFAFSLYLISKTIIQTNKGRALVLIMGLFFLFGWNTFNFSPYILSFYYLPLVLYIYLVSEKINYKKYKFKLLLIILIFFIALYHPLTSIFLITLMLAISSASYLSRRISTKNNSSFQILHLDNNSKTIILISVTSLLAWFVQFSTFNELILHLYDSIIGGSGAPPSSAAADLLSKANLMDLVAVIIIRYGVYLVCILSAFIIEIEIIYNYIKNKNRSLTDLILLVIFCTFLFFTAIFIFIDLIAVEFEIRPMLFLIVISLIIIGRRMSLSNYQIKKQLLPIIFIIVLIVISTLSVFPSPMVKSLNWQTTQMELTAITWMDNGDDIQPVYYMKPLYKYDKYLNSDVIRYSEVLPPHLRFQNISDGYCYILIDEQTMITYPLLYPDYEDDWRFSPKDYEDLSVNENSSKVYTNAENYIIIYTL